MIGEVSFKTPQAMPWGWNPAATFLTAYNAQVKERRDQQEFQLGMEIEKILLPSKIAKAEYEMKKFQMDSEILERIYRNQTAALDQSYSGIKSAIGGSRGSGGSGASSNVAGNGGSSNQAQSRYGGGVANMVQNYLQGGAVPSGGGGKILGQGHTGDDY
jgi:hypothetical protein